MEAVFHHTSPAIKCESSHCSLVKILRELKCTLELPTDFQFSYLRYTQKMVIWSHQLTEWYKGHQDGSTGKYICFQAQGSEFHPGDMVKEENKLPPKGVLWPLHSYQGKCTPSHLHKIKSYTVIEKKAIWAWPQFPDCAAVAGNLDKTAHKQRLLILITH